MKPLLLIIFFAGTILQTMGQTKTIYTCPMHPQIQQDKPGKCPICGMTLVKKQIKVSAPKNPKPVQVTKPDKMPNMGKDTMKIPMGDTSIPKKENKADSNMNGMEMPSSDEQTIIAADQLSSKVIFAKPKTVRYDLYVRDTIVNYTGKKKHAIAINGSIPAPALYFTEGDTAEIYLHNMLNEETSLHWHGVILPNQADGVPFLTTAPVYPGQTHLYKFRVMQNGTYWYHSHSSLQEQIGMYGALIFKRADQTVVDTTEQYNVVLSEWSDEKPMQIHRRLRTANDWYAIKKGSTQSYSEAIREHHFSTKLLNEWKRMKAMDVSDVWYQRFLINGQSAISEPKFKAGDKIKLHIVNAGASSYFWLGYGGGKMTVIGNDGNDVVPVEVDRMIVAPAETYDVLVTAPENMSYEFRVTPEDRTGASSLWLGSGMKMPAPILPRLKYFEGMKMMNDMMRTNGKMNDMGMKMSVQKMDMNMVMYPEMMNAAPAMNDSSGNMPGMSMPASGDMITLNYDMLKSPFKTVLPDGETKTLHFTLTGNMNRYLWTIDNKTVTEADRILINKGENLRLIITNNSMMRHPMHLHGHDFRVLNSQGEYAPLKNVIDIMPMETDSIEFAANKEGNWFFHCHILYHMMSGMGKIFTYANSPVNPELPDLALAFKKFLHHPDQRMHHLMIRARLESNGSDGEAMLSSNRNSLNGMWHLGTKPHHGYEAELLFGRYFGRNQWWFPYIGFDYHHKMIDGDPMQEKDYKTMLGQVSDKDDRKTFVAGVQYTMPWLIAADARVDGNGKMRFQLSREDIPVTSKLRFAFMGNTDKEYMVGFKYILYKWFAVSTHYDSDMGIGAGVTLSY